MQVLLIESNIASAATLGGYLEGQGYGVDYAAHGTLGLRLALLNDFNAIIISARRQASDAHALCRRLRKSVRGSPMIVLIGHELSVAQPEAAFEAGADDYMAQPVAPAEVRARLNALLRRRQRCAPPVLQVGDLTLESATMEAYRQGRRLALSPTEAKLLQLLMEASPHVLTYSELEDRLWGLDRTRLSDTNLRAQIYNLRRVVDYPFDVALIHTRRNLGYRMALPEERRERADASR